MVLLTVTLLCLTLLLPISHSANVLVIAGFRGSHLYVSTDIADKLAEFGHNVTVLTMFADRRESTKQRSFRVITYGDDDETGVVEKGIESLFVKALDYPSADMAVKFWDSLSTDEEMKKWGESLNNLTLKYFLEDEFSNMLNSNNFELVVVEDSVSLPALYPLFHLDIPIVGLFCLPINEVNQRFGLPVLMNSEPSTMNDVTNSPPSLIERLRTAVRSGRLALGFKPQISHIKNLVFNSERNYGDMATYDVVFILDHPVFSFPLLSAPNSFYLGFFNLENRPLQSLEEDYQEFLINCPHQHKILFSFGSYIRDITTFSGTPTILQTLREMDVCVIMKSEVDLSSKFDLQSEKFLLQSWVPQKDLLRSGQIDFFLSHCGNNGKIEAIYYNVPLLCIPLFGDQYYNSRLVERNEFGLLLTRERLTGQTLKQSVETMIIKKENFTVNMRRAADIARNDPGAGVASLKFYTDLLIKNGNADHLINRIILEQWSFQKYNYDIAAVAFIVVTSLTVGIIYHLIQCLNFCSGKFNRKIKGD